MKMYVLRLKFHWSLLLGVQLTVFEKWFEWWLGADQTATHYLNQWWPCLSTQICVTRPQWLNNNNNNNNNNNKSSAVSFGIHCVTAYTKMWWWQGILSFRRLWSCWGVYTKFILVSTADYKDVLSVWNSENSGHRPSNYDPDVTP